MGPAHASAMRGAHFRAILSRPAVVTTMVVAPSAALVVGAATTDAAVALAAPAVILGLILAWAWRSAARAAERAFWRAVREALGFRPFADLGELQLTTPLLAAGDRRVFAHEMKGPIGGTGPEAKLALYRYDVRHKRSSGRRVWTPYRFTVCTLDLGGGMKLFPGVYLRARRGIMGRVGHDWLRGRGLRAVELESAEFTAAYELLVTRDQDDGRLRELFDPKTIVWLTEHPLRPQLEFRAGFLVVYVPGHLEDLGRIVWLLEAARHIASRVGAEVVEAWAAR